MVLLSARDKTQLGTGKYFAIPITVGAKQLTQGRKFNVLKYVVFEKD